MFDLVFKARGMFLKRAVCARAIFRDVMCSGNTVCRAVLEITMTQRNADISVHFHDKKNGWDLRK